MWQEVKGHKEIWCLTKQHSKLWTVPKNSKNIEEKVLVCMYAVTPMAHKVQDFKVQHGNDYVFWLVGSGASSHLTNDSTYIHGKL